MTKKTPKPGDVATYLKSDGYNYVEIYGTEIRADVVIFALMTNKWVNPDDIIHINGKRADDRWSNLRLKTDIN